jgi:hypothetical protein
VEPVHRGSDWLDGALAGWLIVSAVQAAGAVGRGGLLFSLAAAATAALLAGAVVPFLRGNFVGWALAAAGLALHLAGSAARAGAGDGAAAFAPLLPHLAALGYLAWIFPAVRSAPGGPAPADPLPAEVPAPPPGPSAEAALAAIHRRISAAGSACEVDPAEVRADGLAHGLDADTLAREGAGLYRTFLAHFLAAGPPGPAEERELECIRRILGIDAAVVAEVRAEAGLGENAPDPGVPLLAGERALAVREVELYRVPPRARGADGGGTAGYTRAGACRLVLTDRRLLLVAPSGQQSPLPLERVARAAPRADGIEVHPLRGPAVFLRFDEGVEEVAAALARAIEDAPRSTHPPDPT